MSESLDMLVFGAHPDDAEIGMGATLYKHTAAGRSVAVCDLTRAELSSNGTVDSRLEEAHQASLALGITSRTNLQLPDRGLFVCKEYIDRITLEIRRFRPRLVMAPYWQDRHPDHTACSRLVQEAVFNAKLRRYLPEMEPVTVEQLMFYFINDVHEADVAVNVTAFHEKKMSALSCYRSQFTEASSDNDYIATPLNTSYLERVKARDQLLGQRISVPYAEGFITSLPYQTELLV